MGRYARILVCVELDSTAGQHAEKRLLDELPQAERSKILRMKAKPHPDEIRQVLWLLGLQNTNHNHAEIMPGT